MKLAETADPVAPGVHPASRSRGSVPPEIRAASAYLFAMGSVAVAIVASLLIHSLTGISYLFPLYFPILFTAWYHGLRPGLLAFGISFAAAVVFLFAPVHLASNNTNDAVTLFLFTMLSLSFVVMASRGRMSLIRSEGAEEQARASLAAAEHAIRQLGRVQAITDTALNHLDLDALLGELLWRVREQLRGDSASVFLLDDDGLVMTERKSSGPRALGDGAPVQHIGEGFAGRVAATREAAVVDDLSTVPVFSPLYKEKMRSAMGVPLLRETRLIGVLVVVSVRESNFSQDDLGLIELVADRIASAVDHAQLYESAQETTAELFMANDAKDEAVSRHRAMEEQLALLVDASGALIESLRVEDMLPKILRLATQLVKADAYALWRMDARLQTWTVEAAEGLSTEYLKKQSTIAVTPGTPSMPRAVIAGDVQTDPILRDRTAGYAEEGIRSLLALPLRIAGADTGTVTFYSRSEREFSDDEIRIAGALANLSSSAINLARLHEEEARARASVEEANVKLAFLARASDVLSESLEYEETLQKVAQLSVPLLADWCGVNVLEAAGELRTVAVAHHDPAKVKLARELETRYPTEQHREAEHGWPKVLRTGEPDLLEDIPESLIDASARDEDHRRLLLELGLRSSLVVPLIARDTILGAITFVTADLHPRLTAADIPFAQELARRAAIAIDNAQLYRQAQRVAADLQQANAAKDEFLSLVSHELRTPITVILGDSHVLVNRADSVDEVGRAEAIRDINAEAERLNRIIENLLVLARAERAAGSETEPVLLERTIAGFIDTFRSHVPQRAISLHSEDGQLLADGNEFAIEQTIRNFLSNADKYSPQGAPIDLVVGRDGNEATVRVLDRGVGISANETESLFDPFYRSASTATVSGVGIGLTVCKRLVEAQGGRVWARPRDGGGSEFGFSLPLVMPEHDGEANDEEAKPVVDGRGGGVRAEEALPGGWR